jgi:D-alanyl-D-alanine carboxypeptidase
MPILVTLLLLPAVLASGDASGRVDDLVAREMKAHHIPGAVIAVVQHGIVVKKAAYGLANVELGVRCKIDTVFEIGSVTKQLTAALVMILVEEGRLDLNGQIRDLLPGAPPSWAGITVRHLLGHISGLGNINDMPGFELRNRLTRSFFVERLAKEPLEFKPGEKYAYRNTGYALAGYVIEQVCKKPYWWVLKERILDPLKMTATRERSPEVIIRGRSAGYEWADGKLWNRDPDLTDISSAGAAASNVADLLKWNAAIDAGRLLKKESLAAMWTPGRLNNGEATKYGLGWGIGSYRGVKLISHGGSTAGFSASISKFVDQGVTVIVLTNCGTLNIATDLARAIAAGYVNFPQKT